VKLGSVSSLLVPPPDLDPMTWRINRAADLGLAALGISFRNESWREPSYVEDLAALADRRGVELRLGTGGNFSLPDSEIGAEIERVAAYVTTVARHSAIRFASLACGPMTLHRWSPEPPLAERLERLPVRLGWLADAVASQGVVLGVENHCDYRGYEIARILQDANRPNLRAQLDTGNAFSVFEEPVDCARALAGYTVSVHLKDIRVTPFDGPPTRGSRAQSVPLGAGNVDNRAIVQILQEQAPDPAGLALLIEPFYLSEDLDPDRFLEVSIGWARAHLAPYLS
jgi:sugar phosphate isomerase/epimerase